MFSTVLVALGVAGCRPDPEPPPPEPDTDADGLGDRTEAELGTDPDDPDSDDDGLLDGEELAYGADPLVVDTDGDGYTDRDEVFEDRDPDDPASVIYVGGWPYYYAKEDLKGGSYTRPIALGSRFARVDLEDQHGDRLDLFDFYNDTRPVVVSQVAQWCPQCRDLSNWLLGGEDIGGWGAIWPAGPEVVARGDVYWITIVGESTLNVPATPRTARQWASDYAGPGMPVVAENDYDTAEYVGVFSLPSLALLEPDLTVTVFDIDGPDDVIAALAPRFPE